LYKKDGEKVYMNYSGTKKTLISLLILGLISLASFNSLAQQAYRARMSPMPVNPQTVDSITGSGQIMLTLSGNQLTATGEFAGMSTVATMVHIHNGPMAQPGPVVHALEISAATSGQITGTVELTDEQVSALQENELYIQIHSEGNPAGELRGWIFEN